MKKIINIPICLIGCIFISISSYAQVIYAPDAKEVNKNIGPGIQKQIVTIQPENEPVENIQSSNISSEQIKLDIPIQNDTIGLERLAYIIRKKYNDNTICTGVIQYDETHYDVCIENSSKFWANDVWHVTLLPLGPEYEKAPDNGGYWYAYYNEQGIKTGNCQAYK